MTKRKLSAFFAVMILASAAAMPLARAADDNAGPAKGPGGVAPAVAPVVVPTGGRDPRGGGGWTIQQAHDSILSSYQKQLEVSDADFAALKPTIEAVLVLQYKSVGWTNVVFMPPTPATKPAAHAKPTVAQAMMDLRTLLGNKAARPADIKAKLDVLRDARTEAKKDLAKAQDDLRALLTQRQEATLVLSGMLP